MVRRPKVNVLGPKIVSSIRGKGCSGFRLAKAFQPRSSASCYITVDLPKVKMTRHMFSCLCFLV